jgi:hypothetical protein
MWRDDTKEGGIFRMPVGFGEAPGPRQAPSGKTYDQELSPKRFNAYASYATDAQRLQSVLPPNFIVREPTVTFEFSYLKEIHWLAGRGYNILSIRIPVMFNRGGEKIDGFFMPVLWENLADPIISGREELGYNKIYAELPEAEMAGDFVKCSAEWQGFRFLNLILDTSNSKNVEPSPSMPIFHHKYIPSTERWGEADVDYITMTPKGNSKARILEHRSARPTIEIIKPSWNDMPTQYKIVSFFAELPLDKVESAGVYQTVGGKDLSDQMRFI